MASFASEIVATASSREQLSMLADESAKFGDAREEYRWKILCGREENKGLWRCLPKSERERELDRIEVSGSRIKNVDVITNNQEAGVDEGDIVKKLGDRLYVLRQGWIHTLTIDAGGAHGLQLVDSLQVAVDGAGASTWYDEIIAVNGMLILLGFNWEADVSELSVFEVHDQGLSLRSRFWLRGSDYFSGNNYGARVAGDRLLLTVSVPLGRGSDEWPEWGEKHHGQPPERWHALVEPEEVVLPLVGHSAQPYVHALVRCAIEELAAGRLACNASAVVGDTHTESYASRDAMYLAVREWDDSAWLDPDFDPWRARWDRELSHFRALLRTNVFRVPLDRPGEVQVATLVGELGDQFSMKDDGDGLWVATKEERDGATAIVLHRIDWSDFSDRLGTPAAEAARVDALQGHETIRFGHGALWIGEGWFERSGQHASGDAWRTIRLPLDGSPATTREIPHSVDLIEPVGEDLVMSGSAPGGQWTLSLVNASDGLARSMLSPPGQFPAESRSHAFNASRLGNRWILGMPVVDADAPRWEQVSDIALLVADDALEQLARVDMQQELTCGEHCYEFYGDARLFFVGQRIFALSAGLMKELVLDGDIVREVASVQLPVLDGAAQP